MPPPPANRVPCLRAAFSPVKPGLARVVPLLMLALLLLVTGCRSGGESTSAKVDIWGYHGKDPGEFYKPRGIAVSPADQVYVIDRSGRIQIFDCEGQPLQTLQLPKWDNGTPTGMGFDNDGNALIADTHNHRVLEYSPKGELVREWGTHGEGLGEFGFLTDVAVNSRGEYFTCEYNEFSEHRIQKFSPEREPLEIWGEFGTEPGQLQRPMAIECDDEDNLYVADSVNHRIQKYDSEGNLLASWGRLGSGAGEFKYPYDISIGDDGLVYICEYGNHRVQVFTRQGEPVGMFGDTGREPGAFFSPWGVATGPDGLVFVADTENHRVQAFHEPITL